MSLDSVLSYKMSCRNPTLLLGSSNRNFTCHPHVCFYTTIQTSFARHRLYRTHCANKKDEKLQLKDHKSPVWHSSGPSKSGEDYQSSIETENYNENMSQLKALEGLRSLEAYLGSLTKDTKADSNDVVAAQDSFNKGVPDTRVRTFLSSRRKRNENLQNESVASPINAESSDLYLVSALASIDIAVFLFEVASPIKNPEYNNLYSLPLLYGAKVNDLILVEGEWWRLLTPMFLHSGIFHVALSSWVLLDFGPRVCKVYGSFTFFFMCLLGGISGNLTSFLHTPEPTVGGSGPVFAIIGAWLIYQLLNKDMIPKEVSEKMFQKATIATALSFGLVNFGLIDSWTYLGAAVTGITYGFLTCPIVQLDDPLPKASREEGIAVVRQHANPCKSLGVFVLFGLVFSSLLYMIDPPLETPQLENLLEMSQLEDLLEIVK